MKWILSMFVTGAVLLMLGCGNGVNEGDFTPPPDAIILDNFDDNNAQNVLGEELGQFKIDNMNDTNAVIQWGGGSWWSYASDNGGKVITSDEDTIIDSIGTTEDNPTIIAKLMSDGVLYVILNCQGCVGDYWAGIGCDLAGDYEIPYLYDSLDYPGDNSVYWDFSTLDSVRIKMRGIGAALFFLESKAVKNAFTNPDEAWGFHGFSHEFDSTMATTASSFSFSVKDFVTTSDEAANVTWDQAKGEISAFVIEVDTEKDDYLEIEVDKIEFVGLDTTAVFPFLISIR